MKRLLGLGLLGFLAACAGTEEGSDADPSAGAAEEELILAPIIRHLDDRDLAKPDLRLRPDEAFATAEAARTPADDLGALNDEFDDPAALAKWTRFSDALERPDQIKTIDVGATSPGHLYVEPWTSYWFNDFHAPYLYKEVSGDFLVTTRVKVTGRDTDVPLQSFSLAGLLVRVPHEGGAAAWKRGRENWAFITAGSGDGKISQIEAKNTVNSKSRLELSPAKADWVELRIVRRGPALTLLRRFDAGEWTVVRRIDKPELPEKVEVGMIAYTDFPHSKFFLLLDRLRQYQETVITDGKPDLRARFDWVRFQRPAP